jgi:hypothetical protein
VAYDGSLEVIRLGIPIALYPESPLFSGDIVHTREGRAVVRFADRSEIRLKPNTRLQLSEKGDRRDIDVFFGRLWAYVQSGHGRLTGFRTGGTIAAVRGTDLEYAAGRDQQVQVGVNSSGPVDVQSTLADGTLSRVSLNAGEGTTVARGGVPSPPGPHARGSITGEVDNPPAGTGDAPPATPATETRAETPAGTPAAPADETPVPTAPPTEPPVETGSEIPPGTAADAAATEVGSIATDCPDNSKQGVYALQLVYGLGITNSLPPNATAKDAMDLLANLGITPAHGYCDCQRGPQCECGGAWVADACVRIEDLLCITGVDPCDPSAPAVLPLDEQIDRILDLHGELFWLQARKKLTVSPFAP